MSGSRTCIFTIASRNYTHATRTLMEGVERHAPAAHRVLALCDERQDFDFSRDNFEVLDLASLVLPERAHFLFQYSLLELNTAIKPHVIAELFRRGFEKVIYFDPDIAIHSSLEDMLERLDRADVMLTPHITTPYTDLGHPDERELMICGVYNLGYIALKRSDQTEALVAWWQRKLERDCVVDFARGLFTDQKWMDFAPCLCDRVEIVRHPGWNVAYWNLPARHVAAGSAGWTVNGESLVFFHFSGYDPDGAVFSRHQDRYELARLPAAVAQLASDYAAALRRHGYPATTKTAYAHATFPDGTPVPDLARRIFREQRDELGARFADPAGADAAKFIAWLNEPARVNGSSSPCVTRLSHAFYGSRPDLNLREQFPDIAGVHAESFARWFLSDGAAFHRLPELFLAPLRSALATTDTPAAPSGGFDKWLYRTAWRCKDLTHAFVPLKTRQRIAERLFRRAYVKSAPMASAPSVPAFPLGLNIVGYLRAELGIGEASRATIRACRAAGIPFSAVELTKGSMSRQGEEIPAGSDSEPRFGITLLHVNSEQVAHAVADHEDAINGRRVIGYWNWELPELPASWLGNAHFLHEVWAPSRFCHAAFSRSLKIPVVHVPYAIEVPVPAGIGRAQLGLPEDRFVFLYMFDALSVPERKNPMAVVEAFLQAKAAFGKPACLVLKMINGDKESELLHRLRQAMAGEDSILTIQRYLSRPELNALFHAADCYVSLHRSEGFGLTLAEAMYLGKPVIATGWSANMDFMTPWNSVPVPYRLVQLERDHGPYPKGQWWADPDGAAAAAAMVRMVNEPDYARALGEQARRDIREHHSAVAVGRIIADRIRVLQTP